MSYRSRHHLRHRAHVAAEVKEVYIGDDIGHAQRAVRRSFIDQSEGLPGGIKADQEVSECTIENDRVGATPTNDEVGPGAAVEDVVTSVADQGVIAETARQVLHIGDEVEDGAARAVVDNLADDILEQEGTGTRAIAENEAIRQIGVEAAELALEGERVDAVSARDDIGARIDGDEVGAPRCGEARHRIAIDLR